MKEKKELRQVFLAKRQALSEETLQENCSKICQHLDRLILDQGWCTILIFAPLAHEINLLPLATGSNLRFGLPVIIRGSKIMEFYFWDKNQSSLSIGAFGIREPMAAEDAKIVPDAKTLILVPALAVDHKGQRLGYGGGFYDRYLARFPEVARAVVIGDAFFQTEPLPQGPYDQKFKTVVSESGIHLV